MEEIIEDHAREHVANPALSEEERKKGVEELEQLFIQHADNGGCVILTTHQDMGIIKDDRLRKIRLDYRFV